MAKSWTSPFAASGDKIVIPDPAQAGGDVSVAQGWTPDYELPDTDPDYKPVGRDEMNGAFNMVTESVGEMQKQGAAMWDSAFGAYPKGAEVIYAGERWYNPVAGNITEPGAVGHTWQIAGSVPDASTTVKGIVELATTAEARAGDTTRVLTGETGQDISLGWDQTPHAAAASRSFGVTYFETEGKPMFITIAWTSASSVSTATLSINGGAGVQVWPGNSVSGGSNWISLMVPPLGSYRVTLGAPASTVNWTEYHS